MNRASRERRERLDHDAGSPLLPHVERRQEHPDDGCGDGLGFRPVQAREPIDPERWITCLGERHAGGRDIGRGHEMAGAGILEAIRDQSCEEVRRGVVRRQEPDVRLATDAREQDAGSRPGVGRRPRARTGSARLRAGSRRVRRRRDHGAGCASPRSRSTRDGTAWTWASWRRSRRTTSKSMRGCMSRQPYETGRGVRTYQQRRRPWSGAARGGPMSRRSILGFATVLSLVLAACGGGGRVHWSVRATGIGGACFRGACVRGACF